jgi:hypothetical protein
LDVEGWACEPPWVGVELGDTLLVTTGEELAELPELGLLEWPCRANSHTAASRTTTTRPI